tara:strand:- start:10794 stop:12632 length:1839 start_codon:yes stop_codon:yes gene_type:complete
MNKALFIVSLQHELAMAVNNEFDLDKLLKHFIKVCFTRLSLSSAHVYLHQNGNGRPIVIDDQTQFQTRHFLSVPKNKEGKAWQDTTILIDFSQKVIQAQNDISFKQTNGSFLYGFDLPNHGIIIFETRVEFEPIIEKALQPIFNKLSSSCYSNIVYNSLLLEMQARKEADKRAMYEAQHDTLTGLFNQRHIKDLLEQAHFQAIEKNHLGCLIFLGLSRFKAINDEMGHSVGDKILMTLAERLNAISSEQLQVARFSGDEFILLLSCLPKHEQKAQHIVDETILNISKTINLPLTCEGSLFKLTCSIGYNFFPQNNMQQKDIIPFANIAMHEAKRSASLKVQRYEKEMSDKIHLKNAYVKEMKQALRNDEFCLYYQPQYNQNKEIIGAEALLRWYHPTRKMVSPEVYIPIAEESSLILDIGLWVLEQACQDLKILEQLGLPASFKKLSINVSPKQLQQANFKDLVLFNVEKNKIQPKHLGLELTENLLVESFDQSIILIEELKKQGIDCSIDDFGTGYSSLSYLRRIPASLLKIDRSFVINIDQQTEGAAIAKMIISLGNALNMDVLAEGVETKEELACLVSLGCYQYQGYLFSRPVPFEDFLALLPFSATAK